MSSELGPGEVIADRYEVRRLLGSGGMGVVYSAHDRELDEQVAIKVLRGDLQERPEVARRFRSEIKIARRVSHRNVCRIFEYGEHQGQRYVSMEFVSGLDVKATLNSQGPFPPGEAFDVAIQAAQGLAAIHEVGVIHRDLKTANIMRDERGVVRLMDFGIAKLGGTDSVTGMTMAGQIIGTPEYMSPEQAQGRQVDFASDLYALGVVVFELFTGRVPFRGENAVATIMSHLQDPVPVNDVALPEALKPVLLKALAKDPRARFASAAEMADALVQARDESLQAGMPLVAPPRGEPRPRLPAPSPTAEVSARGEDGFYTRPVFTPVPAAPAAASRSEPATPVPPPSSGWRRSAGMPGGGDKRPRPSAPAAPRPPEERRPPPPAGPEGDVDAAVRLVLPSSMQADADALCAFLEVNFRTAAVVSGGALRLGGPRLKAGAAYRYFAVFMGEGLGAAGPEVLGTQTFVAYASPLERHLTSLGEAAPSVVVVVTDSLELGRGVREKILQYRQRYRAVVAPLYVGEIRAAYRSGTVHRLLEERLQDFHAPQDLYATRGPCTDPTTFFGMRAELNQIVAALQGENPFVVVCGPPVSGKTSLVNMAEYGLQSAAFSRVRCSGAGRRSVLAVVDEVAAVIATPGDAATILMDAPGPEPADPRVASLRRRLAVVLREVRGRGGRTVLVMEDADWLIDLLRDPSAPKDERELARELWAALAEFARTGMLAVVVTSVRGYVLGRRVLEGWENPVASGARLFAVSRLGSAALRRMVEDLSAQMNVEFDTEALDEVYRVSAGNVYVARQLCSAVVRASRSEEPDDVLSRVRLSAADVRSAGEELALTRSTFSDTFVAWLTAPERAVLRVVADREPRTIGGLRMLTTGVDPADVDASLEHLRQMGLVARRFGRERVSIPLLKEWVRHHEPASPAAQTSARDLRIRRVGWALSLGCLMAAGYMIWLQGTVVLKPRTAGCSYQVQHPARAIEDQEVRIDVGLDCGPGVSPPRVSLRRRLGTIAETVQGVSLPRFPVEMNCNGGECQGALFLRLKQADDERFAFVLENGTADVTGEDVVLRRDPWMRGKQWFDKLISLALAIPAVLAGIASLHERVSGGLKALFAAFKH
jgi:serine/threonine protein kinase